MTLTNTIGETLRAAREERGWSLSELSRQTRIAVEHLEAIEEDRASGLPPGPYREAWTRTCCEVLDVQERFEPIVHPEPMVPLAVVRWLGLGTLFASIVLFAWFQWGRGGPATVVEPVVREKDQTVEITARAAVKVAVWVDGESAMDERLAPGQRRSFEAYDEIEVRVESVEDVRFRYNGRSIVPQGRQDAPRRVVFYDDGER